MPDSNVSLNSVTNELLNEYNIKFNEKYNDIVQLNSTIQNKEQIIIKIHEVILYKERNILILQYILYYAVSFLAITILYSTKDIEFKQYVIIGIFLAVVFAVACIVHVNRHFNLYNITQKMNSLKVYMKDYAAKMIIGTVNPYQCPSQCTTKDTDDENEINLDYKYKNDNSILKIDPSSNVWKYGDIPMGANLETMEEVDDEDSPQPFFGTSYPRNTYYECKWLGDKFIKNMPGNMKTNLSKYSSIPCNYKPNNTEVKRWFCDEDPNDLPPDGDIKTICQSIE